MSGKRISTNVHRHMTKQKSHSIVHTNEVWLLDDDSALLQAFKYILQEEGFNPRLFITSKQVVRALKKVSPRILFVDLLLTGTTGDTTIKMLKNNPATAKLPVILISGAPNTAHLAEACGANDYIEKPCGIDELLQKITQHGRKE